MKHRLQKQMTALLLAAAMAFTGCGGQGKKQTVKSGTAQTAVQTDADGFPLTELSAVVGADRVPKEHILDDKYRMYYEVFVYSFCDSDGDGTGDLQGVIKRLDYIQNLGCNGIWLMPVMPSNTYHKYDVKDYYAIDSEYGTLDDFRQLLAECDKRGIKVILDLVINHTSVSHEWYQKAAEYLRTLPQGQEPDIKECPYVDYYHFSKEMDSGYVKLSGTDWYYEAKFWDQMPDLNLDSRAVRAEIEKIIAYWANLGVGGFRLDAAKEYFSGNHAKNTEVLAWLTDYCKSIDQGLYLVAEVWDSFETIEQYYGSGIDSLFAFPFAGNEGTITKTVLNAGNGTAGKALADRIIECRNRVATVNEKAIDAPFFSNHDVGRIAGFLRHDLDKMKFAGAVNVLMGGSAFLYYGEELGMDGSAKGAPGKDENKRAPMYWWDGTGAATASENTQAQDAADWSQTDWGMTDGPKDMDHVEHQFGCYAAQMGDADSIYNYYRKLIRIRNAFPHIARGAQSTVDGITDGDICALKKTYDGSTLYLIMNDSPEEKTVKLAQADLALAASLTTLNAQEVTLTDASLTLPAYGIAVLQ